MSIFTYTAVRSSGEKVNGEFDAPSRAEAYLKLDREHLQPVSLNLKGESASAPTRSQTKADRPSGPLILTRRQIAAFTDELSDLLDAGLRLESALHLMGGRQELSSLKPVIARLREQVVEGVSFSAALRSTSASFGELYCGLVAAGEASGSLAAILRRQARHLASMDELQSRVLGALIYPAFLSAAAVALMVIFVTVLVPQMTLLFTKTGKALPLPTRILIGVSNFLVHDWWVIVIALVVSGVVFWRVIENPEGRRWWDRFKLTIPLFGSVIAARFYTQLAQTLATLMEGGIPLLNSLKLVEASTANVHCKRLLGRIIERVADGKGLSQAMRLAGQFPAVFMDVVVVGEHTGNLAAALEKVAIRFDKELNQRIQRLTAMVQPTIIIIMTLVVGAIAYAMITGIFQAISGLRTTG